MNSTLTSSTRYLMVRIGSDGSDPVPGEASGRAMLDAATYGDCAGIGSADVATTIETATSHRHHFV